MLTQFVSTTRSSLLRRIAKLAVYWGCFTASLWLAYLLRLEFQIHSHIWGTFPENLLVSLLIKTLCLYAFGQFRGLWRFFGVQDALNLGKALFLSLFLIITYRLFIEGASFPRSVIVMDYIFSYVMVAFCRVMMRPDVGALTWSGFQLEGKPVLILGAGDSGAALQQSLPTTGRDAMRVMGFLDDDLEKQGSSIHGLPVMGGVMDAPRIAAENRVQEVLIAMPSLPGKRRLEIVQMLRQAKLRFRTVPSLSQIASGQVQITQLRPVEIEDLLGREPVPLSADRIREVLYGVTVMVTGAGGSIGSELCRQIASYGPSRLVMVDRSETQMFPIEQEMLGTGVPLTPAVVDVRDLSVMKRLLLEHRPRVIFHSAAHKHVPLMESQPAEAFKNNTLATRDLSALAQESGVERFVLVSTDKAINPTSVMGATKRLAELVLQARNGMVPVGTRFVSVRFGNVLGSSGSVLHIFREQLARGGPLTVTHPGMQRYFMTIPEAAGLVLQSGAQATGGEIYVLDMGEPVRVMDLASSLIELSGLRPGVDVDIRITGLRPGEKLFEELSHSSEIVAPTSHPRIMQFKTAAPPPPGLLDALARMESRLGDEPPLWIKGEIRGLVSEYRPFETAN